MQHSIESRHTPLPLQSRRQDISLAGFATQLPARPLWLWFLGLRPRIQLGQAREYDWLSTSPHALLIADLSAQTLPEELEGEWYCVVFRSRRNPSSSSISLYEADRAAHQEAVSAGGLVMYWYGAPDETGLNMATCIWQR